MSSKNNNWTEAKIPIKKLSLWDENARFPDTYFKKPEKELIKYFCIKQGKRDLKILKLALAIIKDFDLPQSEKIIVYKKSGENIVLEGNRRLVVYKLLNNPNLAPTKSLKKKFSNLKAENDVREKFELECLITEDKNEGLRYIDRKHLSGNNELPWGEQERTNYSKRRGRANKNEEFKIEIGKVIKKLKVPEGIKEVVLGPGYVTTFWRIINSSAARQEFGLSLNDDGHLKIDDTNFKDKLKVIILNVLEKKDFAGNPIDSRSLNKNTEKEKYLQSITQDDIKKAETDIKSSVEPDLFGTKNLKLPQKSTQKVNPKSFTRNYLIPKSCRLNINPPKINNIYRELREDLLLSDSPKSVPNATGVLFRVFLEVSLDYYAKMNSHNFKKDDKFTVKIPWVVKHLKEKGHDEEIFKNITKVGSASSQKSYLSIVNFHEYVHSTTTQPSSNELKAKWDNLEEFFVTLWESL